MATAPQSVTLCLRLIVDPMFFFCSPLSLKYHQTYHEHFSDKNSFNLLALLRMDNFFYSIYQTTILHRGLYNVSVNHPHVTHL